VIDALSTIMWPSLVPSNRTRTRQSRVRSLLDWARDEEQDDGLRALIADTDADTYTAPRTSRMQREMDELERWLEDEDAKRGREDAQAWTTSARTDLPVPIIHAPTVDQAAPSLRFDDDFTEFVSAPSPGTLDADRLVPMHTGASYRSLASVSDFGGEGENDDEDDPDLPSRAEIVETSRRIFGSSNLLSPSASAHPLGDHPDIDFGPDDDDEFDVSAFDLSRVLNALQSMRAEIGEMDDEGQRRRAAARVALGLVYGLRADRDDD